MVVSVSRLARPDVSHPGNKERQAMEILFVDSRDIDPFFFDC
jgi:hypothetical protein